MEIQHIRDFFIELGVEQVDVYFGWACNFPDDGDSEREVSLRAVELPILIEKSIAKGVYSLGNADVFIRDKSRNLEVLLCHESNIEVKTPDAALIELVRRRWLSRGLQGYSTESLGEKAGETEWEFWGPPGAQPDTRAVYRERLRCDPGRPEYCDLQTRPLAADELQNEARDLCSFLEKRGMDVVDVFFGFGCKLADEECFRPVRMPIWHIPVHIERSVARGVFEPGNVAFSVTERSVGKEVVGKAVFYESANVTGISFRLSNRDGMELSCPNLVVLEEIRFHWQERGLNPV